MVKVIESFEQFQTIINSGKTVVIDFWATWCGPCKMVSPIFEKLEGSTPADKLEFYKVDVDDQSQIAATAGVKAMPTFIFYKNGEKIDEVIGAAPPKLNAAIAKHSA